MNLRSWNRLITYALKVAPALMGRRHRFAFDDAIIEIALPSAERALDETPGRDTVASVGSRWAATNEPINYVIEKVDVYVQLGASIDLPLAVLDVHANAYALVPNEKQDVLKASLELHGNIARHAFEYWLSILQWVTGDHRIGRGHYSSHRSGWGTRLQEVNSGKTVWIEDFVVHAPGYRTIVTEQWSEIEAKLNISAAPPINVVLKLEAEHFLDLGDYRRSMMDTAIACETYLRAAVLTTLPANLAPSVRDQIDKLNVAQYVNHFFPEMLDGAAANRYKKLQPELNSLFAKRNDLFHKGNSSAATAENCRRFLDGLGELFSLIP